ncbi:MAG: preprotein translocase subunit YajC [Bacteroidetes bacterium GWF2_38_335]|nr:MAG: preprotein translocase subunit YajC [Bacteroidetes bacterium GWF2_38_335]OFY79893.1 MAG: preprotein translocase subunit YajC [Bacteroidetes bacterium RIFOXYA12_FULL_38_20]HBS86348.1 preprotein translocase subunit YajC [Bacteroidales bacterium]
MMNQFVFLMAGSEGGEGGGGAQLLFLVLIIGVFYFFMIRPQMRKQKELRKFRESLAKGDKIVTTGGIYGKIAEIKDNIVIIEVEDKMRLRIDINAVIKDMTDAAPQK